MAWRNWRWQCTWRHPNNFTLQPNIQMIAVNTQNNNNTYSFDDLLKSGNFTRFDALLSLKTKGTTRPFV
jgi:hypothetical protein